MFRPTCDFTPAEGTPRKAGSSTDTAASDQARSELLEIVRRARAGQADAQAELMRRYSRRLAGFVRGIIRQPDAVEDVVQVAFIKMFRRLSRLRDPAVFESWLFTLARNSALDFIRRRNCRPVTVGIDEQVNQVADPRNENAVPEILAALERASARLNPRPRPRASVRERRQLRRDSPAGRNLTRLGQGAPAPRPAVSADRGWRDDGHAGAGHPRLGDSRAVDPSGLRRFSAPRFASSGRRRMMEAV